MRLNVDGKIYICQDGMQTMIPSLSEPLCSFAVVLEDKTESDGSFATPTIPMRNHLNHRSPLFSSPIPEWVLGAYAISIKRPLENSNTIQDPFALREAHHINLGSMQRRLRNPSIRFATIGNRSPELGAQDAGDHQPCSTYAALKISCHEVSWIRGL